MGELHFVNEDRYSVTPEELWPLASDTARINRAIGLWDAHFEHTPREDGGSVVTAGFRKYGLTFAKWTEHPFEFVRPRRYSVLREYSSGPLRRVVCGMELEPIETGTLVKVFADIEPRNLLGSAVARLVVGPQSTTRVLQLCREFEAYLKGSARDPFPELAADVSIDQRRAQATRTRLLSEGAPAEIVDRLIDHLRHASDERIVNMRPFELADEWGFDRRATLVTFLRATTAGLLDMRWNVLCPNCRVPKAKYSSLLELRDKAHCETCNITFDANFDRLVEVRFRAAPSIRAANVGLYCIGGPQNIPHVLAQTELPACERAEWMLDLSGEAYRLRSPQAKGAAILDVDPEGTRELEMSIEPGGIAPPSALVAPGQVKLKLHSQLEAPAVVALENRFWDDHAATAAVVSMLQEFRDLFSAEALAPGLQVGIEYVALLFTDLAGSTSMYEKVGQARAFRFVQDHFRVIEAAVRDQQGAVVKTIGDAVMAVFPSGAAALRAALQMQEGMATLEEFQELDPRRMLKVGIHTGPAMVVNLNERLDYFGTTVNIAARTEHEARGGQIMITEMAAREEEVADLIRARGCTVEDCVVMLRGISLPVTLRRMIVVPEQAVAQPVAADVSAAPTA